MKTNNLKITRSKLSAILFFILGLLSINVNAQFRSRSYRGFEGSFENHSFVLKSNITELNHLPTVLQGGQLGLVFGNNFVRARVMLFGYFSSTSDMKGSIDLYTNSVSANLYPLQLITHKKTRLQPYLLGGLSYDRMKFYGYYLQKEADSGPINYSTSQEPFLGRVHQINAFMGGGIDISLLDEYDFVHLFTEVKYGLGVSSWTRNADFVGTSMGNQLLFNIGIRFGAKH